MCPICRVKSLLLEVHEFYDDLVDRDVNKGALACSRCGARYSIQHGVPVFFDIERAKDVTVGTSEHYGNAWVRGSMKNWSPSRSEKWHFDEMIRVFEFPLSQTGWGLEAGAGHGKDTVRLALANPDAWLIAIDLSDGVYITQRRLKDLGVKNVCVIRADLAEIPLCNEVCDWSYSFGVLHHMPSPDEGMAEIARVLKPKAKLVLFLYSDLQEEPILHLATKFVRSLRRATTRLPLPALRAVCLLLVPMVFLGLTVPARLLKSFGQTAWAQRIPHHHNKTMMSIYGELYDRLGARIEHRFNPTTLSRLYRNAEMKMDGIGKIDIWRGWVTWGSKIDSRI